MDDSLILKISRYQMVSLKREVIKKIGPIQRISNHIIRVSIPNIIHYRNVCLDMCSLYGEVELLFTDDNTMTTIYANHQNLETALKDNIFDEIFDRILNLN